MISSEKNILWSTIPKGIRNYEPAIWLPELLPPTASEFGFPPPTIRWLPELVVLILEWWLLTVVEAGWLDVSPIIEWILFMLELVVLVFPCEDLSWILLDLLLPPIKLRKLFELELGRNVLPVVVVETGIDDKWGKARSEWWVEGCNGLLNADPRGNGIAISTKSEKWSIE